MTHLILTPGDVSLSQWRAIYGGLGARLHESATGKIAASAAAVARIIARGEPVYGINTGFGKLASVRIEAGDLETLQRNIVLSHAAGVGETAPTPVVRLMMALKLASLGQGASGVKPETIALLEAFLTRKLTPVVPAQGSVGASGDLAPLAHMAAAMIGVGEIEVDGLRQPAAKALTDAGLQPLNLGPKEGLALLNGTQLIETAGFYNTVGFNDDTRAFLSIPARHDVARRVDCAYLAELVATHRLDLDEAHELAHALTVDLPKRAYKL